MMPGKTEHGQRVIKDSVLSGVAFWEYQRVDKKRIVTCYGKRSIYQRVIEGVSG